MKIDMSPGAITLRLKQVAQLRKACLSLAKSGPGREICERKKTNKLVQRTSKALGR
jgi:hypothetical protein